MDRTNVTDKGYTYNGQNFTNETRTDSQGNNYVVSVPSTISTASLGAPQATIPVTSPVYNTSGQQSLASQAGAYVNTATTAAEQALQAEQDALKASQTDIGRLLTDAGNKGTDIASQYNQQDATGQSVNSLAAKRRQLSARSNALSIDNLAKSQGEINKATGQNITQSAVTRNTADATRENLINQASIAMELAIVDADYQSAKSYADQMVDAKYDKLEAETKAALFNLENNKDRFTAAEKKVAEATAARLRKEEKDIETQKENEKEVAKLIIEAAPVAPSDVLEKARAIQKKGGSATEVAVALGQYGGDYLKNQMLREQLKTEKLQQAKLSASVQAPQTIEGQIAALPKAQQDRYYKLQGDFDKATEKYRGAIDAAGSLNALAENATAQDQTAIIFQYMKTLDPTSTVREGEFALVASTAGLGDRAVNAIKKLDSGQRLNEDQIRDIVGATTKLANEAKKNMEGTAKEYDRRAAIGGLPSGLFSTTQVDVTEDYASSALDKLGQSFQATPKTFLQTLIGL